MSGFIPESMGPIYYHRANAPMEAMPSPLSLFEPPTASAADNTDRRVPFTGLPVLLLSGFECASGRHFDPKRILTADMLENPGDYTDSIILQRVADLCAADRKQAEKEASHASEHSVSLELGSTETKSLPDDAQKTSQNTDGEKDQENGKDSAAKEPEAPLTFQQRWSHRIARMRAREIEDEITAFRISADRELGNSGVVLSADSTPDDFSALFSVEISDEQQVPDGEAGQFREITENKNSSQVDFLRDYPNLRQLRDELILGAYEWIENESKTMADRENKTKSIGTVQEYLRNCVEFGVNAMLITLITDPKDAFKDKNILLFIDRAKRDQLTAFQMAVKKLGTENLAEDTIGFQPDLAVNCVEAEIFGSSNYRGGDLARRKLAISDRFPAIKPLLFTFERIINAKAAGPRHVDKILWSDKVIKATALGGMSVLYAVFDALDRQQQEKAA